MEGHRGFFIIGLVLVGLVGIYAEKDLASSRFSDQQSHRRNSKVEGRGTLLAIEDDAVQPAVGSLRVLKKRSNPPSTSKGGMSKEDIDWHFKEGLAVLKRESKITGMQKFVKESQEAYKKMMETNQPTGGSELPSVRKNPRRRR